MDRDRKARALDYFDKLCAADTLDSILSLYKKLCEVIRVKPTNFPEFFPKVSTALTSFDAQDLLSKYAKRASQKCYENGKACQKSRVLVIGAGPCGLRTAIEAQLLGAKVVVIEKRESFSRNNVLHLWPFLIADLKGLGAKKFYGKFCPGAIDHISICKLQYMLLKITLLLGVEVHFGVGFENIIKPNVAGETKKGWRAKLSVENHLLSNYEFDVMIGAGGKQTSLKFKRKILRAKLAIAITANFVNNRSAAEAKVQEISGVSFIFKQDFFTDLCQATGIDLENIVYYKDETHYFVMTAKKHSLLWKGVLYHDHAETDTLLSPNNVNKEALKDYVMEAVNYATDYKLSNLQFARNYRDEPDLALIDFTAMYQAENACRVVQRKGYKLLLGLVGDSLIEPFWPSGSGCARGFLSSFDVCWMLRSWSKGSKSVTEVISERESMYRLLAQTTHENLAKDYSQYTVDPSTRYPHINLDTVKPFQVQNLYDTDEIPASSAPSSSPSASVETSSKTGGGHKKKESSIPVASSKKSCGNKNTAQQQTIKEKNRQTQQNQTNTTTTTTTENVKKEEEEENSPTAAATEDYPELDDLLDWFRDHVNSYGLLVDGIKDIFIKGNVLCAIIHLFRPDLLPDFPIPPEVQQGDDEVEQAAFRNQLAFDFLRSEFSLGSSISGTDATTNATGHLASLIDYTVQVYRIFKNLKPQQQQPPTTVPKLSTPKIQEPNNDQVQAQTTPGGLKRSCTSIESRNLPQRYFSSVWTLNRKYSNSEKENENQLPSRNRLQRSSSIQRIVQRLDNNNNNTTQSFNTLAPSSHGFGNGRSCSPFESHEPKSQSQLQQPQQQHENISSPEVYANPYRTINNEIRRKRLEEAEQSKVETLKMMHVLQTQKKEERDEERSRERERLIRAMRAQSQILEPPEDLSNSNFKTMNTDDFFDEYKMRLWRNSRPSIGERTQKLENKLVGAALERNPSFCELPIHKFQQDRPRGGLVRSATSVQVKPQQHQQQQSQVLTMAQKFKKDDNIRQSIETKLAEGHGHISFKPNMGQKQEPSKDTITPAKRPTGKLSAERTASFKSKESSSSSTSNSLNATKGVSSKEKVEVVNKKPMGICSSQSVASFSSLSESSKKEKETTTTPVKKKNDFSEYFRAKEEAKAKEARRQAQARERREAQLLQQQELQRIAEAEAQAAKVRERQARRLSEGRQELRLDLKEAVRRAEKMELRKENIVEKASFQIKPENGVKSEVRPPSSQQQSQQQPLPQNKKILPRQNTMDEFEQLFAEEDEDDDSLLANLTPDEVNHLLEWTESNITAHGVDTK